MRRLLLTSALLGAVGASPAYATLQIAVDVNGVTSFCADNTGCDTNGAIGELAVNPITVNQVSVSGSLSESKGTPGNPNPVNFLNTSSLQVTNTSGVLKTITVTVSDVSFHPHVSIFEDAGSGTWESGSIGSLHSAITMKWWGDIANTQGAANAFDTPGALLDTFSSTSTGSLVDAFSHTATGPFGASNPFSMTEQAQFTLVGGGELINRGQSIAAVPELPTWGMALAGFGLLGLAGLRRTNKRAESGRLSTFA